MIYNWAILWSHPFLNIIAIIAFLLALLKPLYPYIITLLSRINNFVSFQFKKLPLKLNKKISIFFVWFWNFVKKFIILILNIFSSEIVFGLSLAVLSSYIFFIITVDYQKIIDGKRLNSYFMSEFVLISSQGYGIIDNINYHKHNNQINLKNYIQPPVQYPCDKSEMQNILRGIDPNKIMITGTVDLEYKRNSKTWLRYFYDNTQVTKSAVERLYRYNSYFSSDIIEKLSALEQSNLIKYLTSIDGVYLSNQDLSFMANDLCQYFDNIRNLEVSAGLYWKMDETRPIYY